MTRLNQRFSLKILLENRYCFTRNNLSCRACTTTHLTPTSSLHLDFILVTFLLCLFIPVWTEENTRDKHENNSCISVLVCGGRSGRTAGSTVRLCHVRQFLQHRAGKRFGKILLARSVTSRPKIVPGWSGGRFARYGLTASIHRRSRSFYDFGGTIFMRVPIQATVFVWNYLNGIYQMLTFYFTVNSFVGKLVIIYIDIAAEIKR